MESKGRGRPKKEITYRKTVGVNVSQDEFLALQLISKNLGYKSTSGFIRSAISKGVIHSQTEGFLTNKSDVLHWQYFAKCWNMLVHLEDNLEIQERIEKSKEEWRKITEQPDYLPPLIPLKPKQTKGK